MILNTSLVKQYCLITKGKISGILLPENTSYNKPALMRSMMYSSILAFCLFFIGKNVHSQTINPEGYSNPGTQTTDSYDGTWQIQVVNSRNQPYIPGNINEIVKENRKKSEVVYIKLDDYIRIKILSEDEISSAGFRPLEKVVHIEE